MMTTVAESCMVDTNVLIHSTITSSPFYHEARSRLDMLVSNGIKLCITPQNQNAC